MLSKIILYTSIATSFFAASAFSTIQVTKQMNKIPTIDESNIASEEEEEESEYIIPTREMSDTEKFINSLTTFGNMEGYINASISKDDMSLTIKGDVFVSLESLTDPKVKASLTIETGYKDIALDATYLNNTAYITLENNNLKLHTSSINEIMEVFSNMNLDIELPSTFSNINTDTLLDNLSKMSVTKDDKSITYTCNLIEGIPPITFTSDLDYNMTSISLTNFEIEGFKIDINASTSILGIGHNKVNEPTNKEEYTDITNYFGVIKQISNIINTKEVGLTYNVDIKKDNASMLSTLGRADVNFNNDLSLRVTGNLYNKDKSLSAPYLVDYTSNRLSFSYNDMISAYYDLSNLNELKSSINELLNVNEIKSLLNNLNDISIPLLDMINEGDYQGIIDTYKGLSLLDNQISITMNNSLFSSNNTNFIINLNIDKESGITSIDINNLAYNNYSIDLSIGIDTYNEPVLLDTSSYVDLSNAHYVVDQLKEYIVNKEVAADINFSISGYTITGYIQADIDNKNINADIDIVKGENTHNIKLSIDKDNTYIIYNNDTRINMTTDSLNSIIDNLMSIITTDNAFKDLLGEIKISDTLSKLLNKDLDTILFTKYLTEFRKEGNTLYTSINKELLDTYSDLSISILFTDHKIDTLSVNASIKEDLTLNGYISLKEYNPEYKALDVTGGWIGASSTSNIVKYVTELDNDTKEALINQIKDIVENKEIGISYDIDVNKNDNHVFNISGDVDVDFSNFDNIKDLSLAFNGNMTNKDNNLDSNVSIKLYNGKLYFNYNDKLLLSYSIDDLSSLIDIIKSKLNNSSPIDLSTLLDTVFPNTSTASAPLFDVIKNKNYISLLSFYKDAYISSDNKLNIVIDGSIINGNDITFTLDTSSKGIEYISISNIDAFGYTLDMNLSFTTYDEVVMSESEMNTYTDMKYINNIFDAVYNLTTKDKFDITLSGSFNLGKGEISVNGSSYFELGESQDYGVADLSLVDSQNKTHNIKIDVNRNKVSKEASSIEKEEALASSQVLFTYNNNLKGKLNLLSIYDTVKLIKSLAEEGNPLLAKLKEALSKDTTESTIYKLMNGEIEAILYDNSLNNITYDEDSTRYDIELNGDLFKKDDEVSSSPIHLYINMDNSNSFKGLGIYGNIMGYVIDLDISISEATSNTHTRLTYNSSYIDFSSIDTLVDYLFNTAKNNDYTLNGKINLDLLDIVSLSDIDLKAEVKLEDGTDNKKHAYGKIEISNIVIPLVAESDWDKRTFNIYLTDEEVILFVHTEKEGKEGSIFNRKYFTTHNYKSMRLTMEQFSSDIAYYLVNYGLGVKTGTIFGKSLDMRNQSTSEHIVDYSKILTNYSYQLDTNNNPSWNIGISLKELTGVSVLSDLDASISASKDNKLLKDITADTYILGSLVHAHIEAGLTSVDTLDNDTVVQPMKDFISSYSDKAYQTNFTSSEKIYK